MAGRFLRSILRLLVVGALVAALVTGLFLALLPGVGDAQARTLRVLQEHGGAYTTLTSDSNIARAIVAVEDRRFYKHPGIDPVSVARAVRDLVTTGSVGGGASIAQQLAKNLYVPDDGTLGAELRQVGMAIKLELHYSKAQVLNMYLNAIYYGDSQWGIEQASQYYFGERAQDLDWAEASMLAGLPQAPSAYAPTSHFALAKQRQRQVLDALIRSGDLTQSQADEAYAETLALEK